MALGYVQVHQQTGNRFGAHRCTSISMQRERARHHIVACHGVSNELLSKLISFSGRDQPAYDVTAEDIEDDVEVKVSPFGRPLELGDVPRPDLVGRDGQ